MRGEIERVLVESPRQKTKRNVVIDEILEASENRVGQAVKKLYAKAEVVTQGSPQTLVKDSTIISADDHAAAPDSGAKTAKNLPPEAESLEVLSPTSSPQRKPKKLRSPRSLSPE